MPRRIAAGVKSKRQRVAYAPRAFGRDAEIQDGFRGGNVVSADFAGTPEQMAKTIRDDLQKWSSVVADAKIRLE